MTVLWASTCCATEMEERTVDLLHDQPYTCNEKVKHGACFHLLLVPEPMHMPHAMRCDGIAKASIQILQTMPESEGLT
jgi:hypothetical protein